MSEYRGSHTTRSRERVSVRGPMVRYADEIEDERQYESNGQQRHSHELNWRQIPPHMQRATTFRPEVPKDGIDEYELYRLAKIAPRHPYGSPSLVSNDFINALNKTKRPPPPDYPDSDSDVQESPLDSLTRRSRGSASTQTSLPSLPSRASQTPWQKGHHSLSGICNKDTISKDNTVGNGAQMDDLLASFGKKVMGVKDKDQYGQAISESTLDMLRPDHEETAEEMKSRLDMINNFRQLSSPFEYLSDSEDEDEIVEVGKKRYILPSQRRVYADKASAAMRYIQSSKKEHKERKRTPQYALDKKNGVPLDIPDEDSEGYESDIIKVEYYETD